MTWSDEYALDSEPAAVPRAIVAISIVGFWAFYFVVSTLRMSIEQVPGQLLMLVARTVVTTTSMAATAAMYLMLRRTAGQSIARDVVLAALLSATAAALYGVVTWLTFDLGLPAMQVAAGTTGAIVVGNSAAEDQLSPLAVITENALNGFFFFAGWCALYVALSHAARTRSLERAAARLRDAARTAELRSLRYQINPHFLFNTLNSLSSLVLSGNNAAAERMIGRLAAFLRASLADDPTHDVTLAEEIEFQRLYLEIETERFRERIRVAIELPTALAAARVPGLIMQPLVENAIKHGVARLRRPVTVRVTAAQTGGRLTLVVDDDGALAGDGRSQGVGLANVRDRIAARFGADGRVTWGAKPDGGFSVTLDLPLVALDDD